MNVGGVDRQLVVVQFRRVERQLFQQPLEHSMQAARADIFRTRS